MWLTLVWTFLSLVAFSEETSKTVYYNQTSDRMYPINLFNEFFAGRPYLVVTDENSRPMNPSREVKIAPPISNYSKFTHSLMFWPFNTKEKLVSNCSYDLGLNAVGSSSLSEFTTTLVNSMTYFEVLKVAIPKKINASFTDMETKNFFIAITLDKTASGYQLTRQLESQAAALTLGIHCDSVVYGGINKVYFFCWSVHNRTSELSLLATKTYILKIKVAIWDPRKGKEVDDQSQDIHITEEQYTRLLSPSSFFLKAVALRTVTKDFFDVALYFQKTSYFFIIRLRDDKFEEFLYPKQSRENMADFKLPSLKTDDTGTIFDIYEAKYIDGYLFLITQYNPAFNAAIPSSYGDVYYLDATPQGMLQLVGKGIVIAIRKGMDQARHPTLSDFLMITHCEELSQTPTGMIPKSPTPKYRISIQVRKYYNGFFYGDQQFHLNISGSVRHFKGYNSLTYFIYIDVSEKTKLDNCTENEYFNTTLYIAPLERPFLFKELIRFEDPVKNPVRILVSTNNNLLYVRSSYKLEVFNLEYLTHDLKDTGLLGLIISERKEVQLFTYASLTSETRSRDPIQLQKPFLKVLHPRTALEMSEYVTLDDAMNDRKMNMTLTIEKTEQQNPYTYPLHLEDISVVGNYITFANSKELNRRAELFPFEPNPMLIKTEFQDESFAQLYGMTCNGRRYVLISYMNHSKNIIYILNEVNQQYEYYMTLYDNRMVTTVQEVSNDKYLLHIEGLLYELYILNQTMNPLFKSNDLCGEVSTPIDHNELGPLTICGGNGLITIFASTTTEKNKIDLSSPIDNMRINPSLVQSIKQESIDSLFGSVMLENRFGTLSKIITKGNLTAANFRADVVSMVRVRLFEISSSMQYVDVLPESETEVTFKMAAEKVLPYLIGDRLVLLVRFVKTLFGMNTEDSIYVYLIDHAFKLKLEKVIQIPVQILADFDQIKPLMTYLPVKKTLQVNTYGPKLLIMFSVEKKSYDITKNFDFFDYKRFIETNQAVLNYTKKIGVFDPTKSSLDCIKILDMPSGYVAMNFGSYFLDVKESDFGMGALIAARNGDETRIFFMNDHSLIVDFHILSNFDDFSQRTEVLNNNYTFLVKNQLNKQVRNISLNLYLNPPLMPNYNLTFNGKADFNMDISNSSEMNKRFMLYQQPANSQEKEDIMTGLPYHIDFLYDSKIEAISKHLTAHLTISLNTYSLGKIDSTLKIIFNDTQDISMVKPRSLQDKIRADWLKVKPVDYVDILYLSKYIAFPKCELQKGNTDVRPNPNLKYKRRCVKFFYMDNYLDSKQDELYACLELNATRASSQNFTLNMYIFDERTADDNLYHAFNLEQPVASFEININKVPLSDIEMRATMNFLIVLKTSSITGITYAYEIFRVEKAKRKFAAKSLYKAEVWSYQISFINYFYKPASGNATELFCSISTTKIEKLVLSYYCALVVENSDFSKVFDSSNMNIKKIDVFSEFNYEDINSVIPDIMIYSQYLSPVESLKFIEEDPNLYFMITFPTYLSAFVRVPIVTQNNKPNFQYVLLCNPFEGYLFSRELQTMNNNYYIRFGVRKTDTYAWFYNLPTLYVGRNMTNYRLFYKEHDFAAALIGQKQLECLKPTLVSNFTGKQVERVFRLEFYKGTESNNKVPPKPNLESYDIIGGRYAFTVERSAFQVILVTENGQNFSRMEYLPAIEVNAQSQLLFSDRIELQIHGLRNRTAKTYITIKSGSFTNMVFLFKYMLPLIIVILGLILLNWLLRYVFYNQDPDDPDDSKLPSIFRVKEFARRISNLKKRASLDAYGPRNTVLSSMTLEANVMNNYKKKIEDDRVRKEAILCAKRSKEILGIHSELLESDLSNEIVELMFLRRLRDNEILKVDIEEEEEEKLLDEDPLVTSQLAENYADYKDFMEMEENLAKKMERRERKLKKNVLQMEEKDESEESESVSSSSGSSGSSGNRTKVRKRKAVSVKSEEMDDKKVNLMSDDEDKKEIDEDDLVLSIAPSLLQNLTARFDSGKNIQNHRKHE